jgi:predicted NBD/HSP70 family sugar kinase
MKVISGKNEIKKNNCTRIVKFILEKHLTSRQEISKTLNLSMPTVFSNVTGLINTGLLSEAGEYGSTGGRKAKALAISRGYRSVAGIDITKRHVRMLLLDLSGEQIAEDYYRCLYEDTSKYYNALGDHLEQFLDKNNVKDRSCLIGVGISIPGIIIPDKVVLSRSHILNVQNISLLRFSQNIRYPVLFDNDANCAAFAEVNRNNTGNMAFFSLSNTVGGAIYQNGILCAGDNYKSGEFGHMIIHPDGKKCYCGKKGCMDPYCSTKALLDDPDGRLEDFFEKLSSGDKKCNAKWDTYLDDLALSITNIRMAFDCKIVLGGYIGGYIEQYMDRFTEKVRKYNNFDPDTAYISTGKYKRLSSAVGAAKIMVYRYIDQLEPAED